VSGERVVLHDIPMRRRQAIHIPSDALVSMRPFSKMQLLPYLVEPVVTGLNLLEWLASGAGAINSSLSANGALLLRGFGAIDATSFERAIGLISGDLIDYVNRSTPRSRVAGRIFTSTEYPADQSIPLHN
jgi:hypothetical protein